MNIFKNKTNKGFTIIELIVVIAIIAVLSAIVMTNVTAYQKKARNAQRLAEVKSYATAFEIAYENNGSYPIANPSFCCLGSGYPGGKCYGGSISECSGTNDILKQWIALPFDNYPVMIYGSDYRGYLYIGNTGKRIDIYWYLEGANQPCGIATYSYSNISNNYTWCAYSKSI